MTIHNDRKRRSQLEPLEKRDNPGGHPHLWGAAHLTPDHTQKVAYFFGTATTRAQTQSVGRGGSAITTSTVSNGFSNVLYQFTGALAVQSAPGGGPVQAVAVLTSQGGDQIELDVNGSLAPLPGGRQHLTGTFDETSGTGQFASTTAHGAVSAVLRPDGVTKLVFIGKIYRPLGG